MADQEGFWNAERSKREFRSANRRCLGHCSRSGGYSYIVPQNDPDMICPGIQGGPLLGSVCRTIVNARDASLMAANVIQHRFDDMRRYLGQPAATNHPISG
jgi:hypothetical protein